MKVLPLRILGEFGQFVSRHLSDGDLRNSVRREFGDMFTHFGQAPEIRAHRRDLPIDPGHNPSLILFHYVNP